MPGFRALKKAPPLICTTSCTSCIGQEAAVINIYNFTIKGTIEERIYKRLLERINIFREALGDLEDILTQDDGTLSTQISDLERTLYTTQLTEEQQNELIDQVEAVVGDINRLMYRIFNGRVYSHLRQRQTAPSLAKLSYHGQPCFVYGGGAGLPVPFSLQRMRIHDQGRPNLDDEDRRVTCLIREQVGQYVPSSGRVMQPHDLLSAQDFALLAEAFGLSIPQLDSKTYVTHDS